MILSDTSKIQICFGERINCYLVTAACGDYSMKSSSSFPDPSSLLVTWLVKRHFIATVVDLGKGPFWVKKKSQSQAKNITIPSPPPPLPRPPLSARSGGFATERVALRRRMSTFASRYISIAG